MKRGRKSVAETSVTTLVNGVTATDRIGPPVTLTDAERDVWLQAVNDQPASFFTETHAPLLEMYCRHVVQSRIIADEILNFDRKWLADDDGLKRYDRLLAMQEREGRAASSLATRLRITKQAVDQQTVARSLINQPKAKKPWEI
jgi:hypothetical protein